MVVWPIGEINNGDDSGDSSSTSPTTVTVIEIVSNVSTSSSTTTFQSNSLTSIPLTTTTTVTTSEINSSSSRISTPTPPPTSTSSLAPSVSRSSSTLSHPNSSEAPLSQNNKTFSASSLNSGAIAGIVLACLFTFLVVTFFAIRIWSKKKRALKQRKMWSRSMFSKPYAIDAPGSSYEAKLVSGNRSSRGLPHSVKTLPNVSVPPISYNNDAVFQYSTTPVTSSPSALTSPVYSPGLMSLSPYSTTVVCTFIPSLPDELTISVGETLLVLAGYEDGWSLCKNGQGKQGMVPNECLEKSFSSMGLLPPNGDGDYRVSRSSARVSSLAQAVRRGR